MEELSGALRDDGRCEDMRRPTQAERKVRGEPAKPFRLGDWIDHWSEHEQVSNGEDRKHRTGELYRTGEQVDRSSPTLGILAHLRRWLDP